MGKVIRPYKRITPPDDLDRLAENFWQEHKGKIRNKHDFDEAYDDYVEGHETEFTINSKEAVWDILISKPQIKRVTEIEAKPVKRGKPKQFAVKKRILNIPSKSKGKFVYAEEVKIRRRNKDYTVYRDAKGRFVRRLK